MPTQMNSEDPLDQLKPIILPDHGVSLWPLAPGWCLLLGLVISLIILFVFLQPILKKRIQRKQILKNALEILNTTYSECSTQKDAPLALQVYLQKSNDVFKRIIHANPQLSSFSHLTGQSWIDFILMTDPESKFSTFYGDNLYASHCAESINLADLHQWAYQWITKLPSQEKKISAELQK